MEIEGAYMGRGRKLWALGAASIALWSAMTGIAAAQDAGDEIIVVAQKRSENIQDVPISVSALSSERLDSVFAGGADIVALSATVPGLNVESSNGRVAPRFYIRGLGNIDFDLGASQPVSVIMDDVVMENVSLKSFPLFDIAQVEVYRGPQGTLFGRNTTAGIVNIISARPTDEFEATFAGSYGTYGSASLEGAISGPIAGSLSGRAALMFKRRDDWIDNTYTGPGDYASEIGGFEDIAGRVQLLFEPNENFSALLNLHARSLDGNSATAFRANIFDVGSNELNGNFDRDSVYYNGGGGNAQEYDQQGATLTMTYDFGGPVLTSITGYETVDGSSRGDIDGGVAGDGPGFIPFDSDTADALDGLTQFTQEVRLASPDDGLFTWQIGAFYFDSEVPITTVGGLLSPASATHTNESWAVFGQGSWSVSDALTLTAGVRYTDDDKELTGPTIATFAVSDSQVSWDLSAAYQATADLNLYARVAQGFRAPSIQGRDIAFFGTPSIATSETATSYEVGFKSDVLGGTGRINAAAFYYTIEDMQLTVIGGASNSNQLVNAEEGVGHGFEVESEFAVTENFLVTAGVNYTHTEINDSSLLVLPCGTGEFSDFGNCTVRDPRVPVAVGINPDAQAALIDGNPFPQAPEFTLSFTARYAIPLASGGEWFAFTDWYVRGPLNIALYDAVEFQTDTQVEGGLSLGYQAPGGAWEASIFARNVTDEENVIGGIDFNNLTGFVNEPRIVGIALRARM